MKRSSLHSWEAARTLTNTLSWHPLLEVSFQRIFSTFCSRESHGSLKMHIPMSWAFQRKSEPLGFCLPGNANRCSMLLEIIIGDVSVWDPSWTLSSKYSLQKVLEKHCLVYQETLGSSAPDQWVSKEDRGHVLHILTHIYSSVTLLSPALYPQVSVLPSAAKRKNVTWHSVQSNSGLVGKSLEVTIKTVFGSRLLRQGFQRLLASTEICS